MSVRAAVDFAHGQHAGGAPYVVVSGALVGALLVLASAAVRRRMPAAVWVLLGGFLGSWAPMLASAAWTAVDPTLHMPFTQALTFWLVWAAGGILGITAPIGLWLLWLPLAR